MSYDVGLVFETGGAPVFVSVDDLDVPGAPPDAGGNYTSNVSPIWTSCLTAVMDRAPQGLAGSDGRLALRDLAGARLAEVVAVLGAAIAWGEQHLAELRAMNPSNGHGNAEGALSYLRLVLALGRAYPQATLGIDS